MDDSRDTRKLNLVIHSQAMILQALAHMAPTIGIPVDSLERQRWMKRAAILEEESEK